MKTPAVLVIDDHADIRRLVRWALEMLPVEVKITDAPDATTGLDWARLTPPDLIILDVMMPGGIDGLEACRRLAKDPRTARIPRVLLSSRSSAADIKAGLDAGATAYLVKPFLPARLVGMAEKLLGLVPSAR